MSQYLVLSHIEIQNANAIAGLTWGFPAITGFLGFTHALGRKITTPFGGNYDTQFTGCAVISHTYQNKVYQPKPYADYEFIQSRNPPVLAKHKEGKQVPIIEEGKMNLTVSLIIQLATPLLLSHDDIKQFEQTVLAHCYRLRVAGGSILTIRQVKLLSANTDEQYNIMLKKVKRLTLPGFVLWDRSHYLQEHYQTLLKAYEDKRKDKKEDKPTLFDAWLDFCALKSQAIPILVDEQTEPDEQTEAEWQYLPKPKPGYLVPLMTGFKAISPLYPSGEIANTRDKTTPTCFVEAIHSVGEWKGVHALESLEPVIWRYQADDQWYLCKQERSFSELENEKIDSTASNDELLQTVNFNDALNNW